jgi:hypothetical protein
MVSELPKIGSSAPNPKYRLHAARNQGTGAHSETGWLFTMIRTFALPASNVVTGTMILAASSASGLSTIVNTQQTSRLPSMASVIIVSEGVDAATSN